MTGRRLDGDPSKEPIRVNYDALIRCTVPSAYSELLELPMDHTRVFVLKDSGKKDVHAIKKTSYPLRDALRASDLVLAKERLMQLLGGNSSSAVPLYYTGEKPRYSMPAGHYYVVRTLVKIKPPDLSSNNPNEKLIVNADAVVLVNAFSAKVFVWFVK